MALVSDALVSTHVFGLREGHTSVRDALHALHSHGVTALALVNSDGTPERFVDYLALLSFLVEACAQRRESRITGPSTSLHSDDVGMVVERAAAFAVKDVRSAGGNKAAAVAVGAGAALSEALAHMRGGVHRVAVVDGRGKMTGVLSQSDVLRWAAHNGKIKYSADMLEADTEPFSVRDSDAAVDAFIALWKAGVTGAAVVDAQGALVGSFSSSDLKGVKVHESFIDLLNPVHTWMRMVRREADHEAFFKLIWVTRDTKPEALVKRFLDQRVHRVFVVDSADSMKLSGVITLTNMMRFIDV